MPTETTHHPYSLNQPLDHSSDRIREIAQQIRAAPKHRKRPFVIAVCGGSCSGKSTHLARLLSKALGKEECSTVELDHFQNLPDPQNLDPTYRWDHPSVYRIPEVAELLWRLKNGQSIEYPVYDFATQAVTRFRTIEPRPYLIVEGLYAATGPLQELADLALYAHSPAKERLVRRIFRNQHERYRSADPERIAVGFLTSVTAAHLRFVAPQAQTADSVYRMPYRFSDTVTKFSLEPVDAPTSARIEAWASAGEATLALKPLPTPRFTLQYQGAAYLDFPISPSAYRLFRSSDPEGP